MPEGVWVNFLGTNDDQCFMVISGVLITILSVIQAKSVGISRYELLKLPTVTSFNKKRFLGVGLFFLLKIQLLNVWGAWNFDYK